MCLNCETDFVAKNDDFSQLANTILDLAIESNVNSKDELLQLNFSNSFTVGEKITEQSGVIGEKIEISSFEKIEAVRVLFSENTFAGHWETIVDCRKILANING